MRIGILGGTFDPIHNAHLMIAEKAISEFNLNKVLIMPSPNPPHKSVDGITSIEDRINMIKLAIEGNQQLEFSDFELNRKGYVYSADTLRMYKELHPDDELYFIIGSDSLFTIDSWYHPEIIFANAGILVSRRDDASQDSFIDKINYLKSHFQIDISEIIVNVSGISSSKIRMLSDYSKLSKYVPGKVAEYIDINNLYNEKKKSKMTNAEIIEDLKIELDSNRLEHTLGVADTAKKMAEALGENPNKAYLAGLLHDCAKCIPDDKKIDICRKNKLPISQCEEDNPYLLHGKVGAYVSKNKYHVTDEDILNAITYHTTGRPDMSLLEKIVFTADYIEPGRTKQPNLGMLRDIAYKDIDRTVLMILKDTLEHLQKKCCNNIDTNTVEAFEFYSNANHKK